MSEDRVPADGASTTQTATASPSTPPAVSNDAASAAPATPTSSSKTTIWMPNRNASSLGSGAKVCCVCGMDLRGHTRYRNARGMYWCRSCHMISQAATKRRKRKKQLKAALLVIALAAAVVVLIWLMHH